MGVLDGIIVGITAALLYQRFYRIKLPDYLAFFGGRRFVPIITGLATTVLGVIFGLIWPYIGAGFNSLGNWIVDHQTIGAGVYGVINRLLAPDRPAPHPELAAVVPVRRHVPRQGRTVT